MLEKNESLTKEEIRKGQVLARYDAGDISAAVAAGLLGVTPRQVLRMLAAFRANGRQVLPHGNRGRTPSNRTDAAILDRIVALAGPGGKYSDFNVIHLHEKLAENEGIVIGRSTLDALLKEQGLRTRRRPAVPIKRMRRERCPAEGMMLQIDGSPHDWLEGRGASMSLMGGVDDATSKMVYACFRPTEDLAGYLMMARSIACTYGLPLSYYHDRHTILQSPKKPTLEEELAGREPQSQFERVMRLLGVESIAAHSPQAKGRIERLWRTLQDRLTKELRLAGVSTLEEANAFLPGFLLRHNARFAIPPTDPVSAWVPVGADLDLCYYFATQESRVVNPDHTIHWHNQCFLNLRPKGASSLSGRRINVHVVPEGDVYLYDGTERLDYRFIGPGASTVRAISPTAAKPAPSAPALTKPGAKQRAWMHAKRVP